MLVARATLEKAIYELNFGVPALGILLKLFKGCLKFPILKIGSLHSHLKNSHYFGLSFCLNKYQSY